MSNKDDDIVDKKPEAEEKSSKRNKRKRNANEERKEENEEGKESNKASDNKKKEPKEDIWMLQYNKLVEYQKQHGSTEVPQRYSADPSLGNWTKNQREYYKSYTNNKTSSLTEERVALLNKIGFAWVSTKTKRRVVKDFDVHLAELEKFKQVNGHTRVPHVYAENPGLGVFAHRLKIYYREMQEGKRKSPNDWLTPARIELLNGLQFEWKVGRWKNALTWEERYAQLVEHKDRKGDCNVSKEYDEQNAPGLKAWIANQRSYLTRSSGKGKRIKKAVALSEERMSALKSLGVSLGESGDAAENIEPAGDDEEETLFPDEARVSV